MTTTPAAVTWATVGDLIADRWRGTPAWRNRNSRAWYVPSPTGGAFSVDIDLRPRWCGGAFASATPIARAVLLDVLTAWVDQELTWGLPSRSKSTVGPDEDPDIYAKPQEAG